MVQIEIDQVETVEALIAATHRESTWSRYVSTAPWPRRRGDRRVFDCPVMALSEGPKVRI
jgi:hypothetical protein